MLSIKVQMEQIKKCILFIGLKKLLSKRRYILRRFFKSVHWTIGYLCSASCRAAVFRIMMPIGGCGRRPYPELPAGEVESCASESWGEKLPHLLPASGGRRGGPAAPARPA